MSGLLNLHRIAAARGDGLLPELAELLEARAAREAANVVELGPVSGQVQDGPMPGSGTPGFLPGNVVTFRRDAAQAEATNRKTVSKAGD